MVRVNATQHVLVVSKVVNPVGTLRGPNRDLPFDLNATCAHNFGVANPDEPEEKGEYDKFVKIVSRANQNLWVIKEIYRNAGYSSTR